MTEVSERSARSLRPRVRFALGLLASDLQEHPTLRAQLDEKIDLARYAARVLKRWPDIDLAFPPELSLLAFRVVPKGVTDPAELDRVQDAEIVTWTDEILGAGKHLLTLVNQTIDKGEFVCIIGHSGCGKTTILNALAGLETASDGILTMDGREVAGPGLDRGVVFQSHALMPWMSVIDNVKFGVRSRWPDWSKAQIEAQAAQYLEMVGLGHALHKKPSMLSGGMKQRVGIARAFAIQPKMLLLDEPFGALDALTRASLQDELIGVMEKTGATVVMVTHDVDEAVLLSDRVVMMTNGPAATIGEVLTVDGGNNQWGDVWPGLKPDYFKLEDR